MAKRTRLAMSPTSSFAMMRLRYVSMLLGFTPTIAAISLLVLPSTTSFRTWRSRGLSTSSAAGLELFLIAQIAKFVQEEETPRLLLGRAGGAVHRVRLARQATIAAHPRPVCPEIWTRENIHRSVEHALYKCLLKVH